MSEIEIISKHGIKVCVPFQLNNDVVETVPEKEVKDTSIPDDTDIA